MANLFNLIMIHGYAPNDFGYGIVVWLLKDRCGDVSKLDNYRAIRPTISCVISEVFELCICDKFGEFLYSHPLQFGFKKGIGCQNAISAMQQTVKYFTERGSTVFISTVDASKAFDRICHVKLIDKLSDRNFPCCLIVCSVTGMAN